MTERARSVQQCFATPCVICRVVAINGRWDRVRKLDVKVAQAQVIVIGNEKGGAGKSTVAIQRATALLHESAVVVAIDLDTRQQPTGHFFSNRTSWIATYGVRLPEPRAMMQISNQSDLDRAMAQPCDFILVSMPGADTELARKAHGRAHLIVTPDE